VYTVLEEGFIQRSAQRLKIWSIIYSSLSFSGKGLLMISSVSYPFLFKFVLIYLFTDYILFSIFWSWILYCTPTEVQRNLFWQCCCFILLCAHIFIIIILEIILHIAWPVLVEVSFLISISFGGESKGV
jgi:hypothetical protein